MKFMTAKQNSMRDCWSLETTDIAKKTNIRHTNSYTRARTQIWCIEVTLIQPVLIEECVCVCACSTEGKSDRDGRVEREENH